MRLTANGRLAMPRPDWARRAADDKADDACDVSVFGPGGSVAEQRDVEGVWWTIAESGARLVHRCSKDGACPKCGGKDHRGKEHRSEKGGIVGETVTCACGQLLEFVVYGPCIWFEDQSPEE